MGASANDLLPPLLKQSKVLACTTTESDARNAISLLWEIEDNNYLFPDEYMLKRGESTLHAATLDIVLKSMLDATQRFPSLRNQVERTLLKWNYCDVFREGTFYNLERTETGLKRSKAAKASPANWQGFKALGFLGETDKRFIPNILDLDQNSLRSDYEWLFHRTFREQCFPHPDTSELFDSTDVLLKENIVVVSKEAITDYPYTWDSECLYSRAPPALNTSLKIELLPIAVPKLKPQLQLTPVPQLVPGLRTQILLKVAGGQRKVPLLKTKLLLESTSISVPKLLTKVSVDKPKYIAAKNKGIKKPTANYAGKRAHFPKYLPQTVVQKPFVQRMQKTQLDSKPKLVINKDASLIERLLGGVSGGNVLIVDKIQLTVNEYNGTVETAISSSDIGSSLNSTESRPDIVEDVLKALPVKRKARVTTAINRRPTGPSDPKVEYKIKTVVESKAATINKMKKPPVYLAVPELQSMLLVSQKRPVSSLIPIRIPSAKASRKGHSSRNKQRRRSSELAGSENMANKSVKQLLIQYQQFEEDRKLGRLNKKGVAFTENKPDPRVRDIPPLNTELWFEKNENPILVPRLNSRVKFYKKFKAKSLDVPALSTLIIQQISKSKGTEKQLEFQPIKNTSEDKEVGEKQIKSINNQLDRLFESDLFADEMPSAGFSFSTDRMPDEIFEKTLIPEKKNKPEKTTKKAKPKKKTIGLAGNVYLKHSLKNGDKAVGGSINRKLKKDSYWFARVGWNYSLEESNDPFSYSWGIGYSDWHAGTFSAQLNNWGPIKPEDGLALEKAVANFGYSVKSDFLKKNKLSLSGSVNVPIEGNSSVVGNLRWSPVKNWYVNAAVSQPLEGDGSPKWTYGFGYSDWRPNKINLQYSNYGPNEIPYHNYQENGTWSLSYNWKF